MSEDPLDKLARFKQYLSLSRGLRTIGINKQIPYEVGKAFNIIGKDIGFLYEEVRILTAFLNKTLTKEDWDSLPWGKDLKKDSRLAVGLSVLEWASIRSLIKKSFRREKR